MKLKRELTWWMRRRFGSERKSEGELDKSELRKHLPANPVIVEAGAHRGQDTEEMSFLWPEATIHAFEPVPELNQLIRARIGYRKNLRLYNSALGAHTGKTTLNISSGASDASSSIMAPKDHLAIHPTVKFEQAIEVPVTTLSDFMKAQQLSRIDLLWLDLQGAEFCVMQASEDALKHVRALYLEVNLVELYAGSVLYPDLKAWLAPRGFKVEKELLAWKDAGNVLFVRA